MTERIKIYREIDGLKDLSMLDELQKNLVDRFGTIPESLQSLFKIVRIRWIAEELGFEKLILKNRQLIAHFISNQDSGYFSSHTFAKILNFVQQYPELFRMKESKNKLTLAINPAESIDIIYSLFVQLRNL